MFVHRISQVLGVMEQEERKKLLRFGLLSLFSPVAELFSVSMILPIFNQAFNQAATRELVLEVLLVGLVLVLIGGFELLKNRVSVGFATLLFYNWSTKIYWLYMREGLAEHNEKTQSQAVSGVWYNVTVSAELIVGAIGLAVDLLTLLIYFGVMIYVAKGVGVLSSVAIAGMVLMLYQRNRVRAQKLGKEKRQLEKRMGGLISTAFASYKELKIDLHREELLSRYQRTGSAYAAVQQAYAFSVGFQGVVLEHLMQAGLFFLLALVLVAGVDITRMLAQVAIFLTLLIRLIPGAKRVANALIRLFYSSDYLASVQEDLVRYRQVKGAEEAHSALREKRLTFRQGIRVRGLTFRYPGGKLILEDAEIDVPAGASVAVIGPSGEGKTTFLDLILGLLIPQAGQILYDDYDLVAGADAQGPCRADLGQVVSYIPQLIYLDNETVRSNVVFTTGEPQEERVVECLRHALVWKDVCELPQGLDTVIGQNGAMLSGGQRQRIALARALYKDSDILIMDEATAALDMETEQAVLDSIRGLEGNKTLLMVTHHPRLAEACEHIYRIENRKLRKVR